MKSPLEIIILLKSRITYFFTAKYLNGYKKLSKFADLRFKKNFLCNILNINIRTGYNHLILNSGSRFNR